MRYYNYIENIKDCNIEMRYSILTDSKYCHIIIDTKKEKGKPNFLCECYNLKNAEKICKLLNDELKNIKDGKQ